MLFFSSVTLLNRTCSAEISMPVVDKALSAQTTISMSCHVSLPLPLMLSFDFGELHIDSLRKISADPTETLFSICACYVFDEMSTRNNSFLLIFEVGMDYGCSD